MTSTTKQPLEILLVGFGAVGVVYAYMFEKSAQAKVTAVARSNFELINQKGIHIESPSKFGSIPGWKPSRLVHSVEDALDREYDYVVVTTKSLPDVYPVERILEPIIKARKTKTFVLIQNGLGIEEGLYAASREIDATILTSVCYISTNLHNNRDEVLFENTERLEIGVYHPPSIDRPSAESYKAPSSTESQLADLNRFVEMLKSGEGNVKIEDDMELIRFKKNVWNCCWASLACLARAPLMDFIGENEIDLIGPSVLEFCNEVAAIGYKARLPLPENFGQFIYDGTVSFRREKGGKHKPSALVDLETGRPLEIEVTVGNVLKMARRLNIKDEEIKILRLVYGLGRVLQKKALEN
uniref:2-dehydropantoate 2-reductase/6 phosphogluconate dehydrogenase C-terminal domain-like protein n=1 Tax=Phaffia rhodozyma TaxID=264483 RepID=A0A1C9U6A4_PHARH|nr:2-dehydropantoate 2-reductase/6 phosphogluconate dehydrogenase C-terminal domain-like protein [Phaffia rhodozyma]